MLDLITRMFVVVDVDRILDVFHVAIRRLEKLIDVKSDRIRHNEVVKNKAADEITFDISEQARAHNIITQLEHIVSGKSAIDHKE